MFHFVLKLTDPTRRSRTTCPERLNETLENDLKKALRFPNHCGSGQEWPANVIIGSELMRRAVRDFFRETQVV